MGETAFTESINNKKFTMRENPMAIKDVRLSFSKNDGVFEYKNAQGKKEIYFGMNENIIAPFPQEGYSNEVGNTYAKGNYYRCAASAAWLEKRKMLLDVQIIDKYLGRIFVIFSFTGENTICISMIKTAEDFLDEYNGYAEGRCL